MHKNLSVISNESIRKYKNGTLNLDVKSIILRAIMEVLELTNMPNDSDTFTGLDATQQDRIDIKLKIEQDLQTTLSEEVLTIEPISDYINFIESSLNFTSANENLIWDDSEFKSALKELNRLSKILNQSSPSQEGFGGDVLRVFLSVADVFIKVGNSFKTCVTKFYKSIKRSEMRNYYESHLLMCKNIESQRFDKVMNLKVPVPSGMVCSYAEGLESLLAMYNALDVMSYASKINDILKDVRIHLSRNENCNNIVDGLASIMDKKTEDINKTVKDINNKFTDDTTTDTVVFKKAYASMQEFKNVRCDLLSNEHYLNDTSSLVKTIDSSDAILVDITKYLSDKPGKIDEKFVNKLIFIVKFAGTAFNYYGINCVRQMALEHNHICVIDVIRRSL